MPDQPTKPAPAPPAAPQDDDDLRGYYFGQLVRSPATQMVTMALAVAAGIGLAIAAGPAVGGIAALAVILIALIVCFSMASKRAASAFYANYAASRGLTYNGSRGSLPPVSELLRKGDRRYTDRSLTGALPAGPNGVLAHFTYEEESTDSEGNRETSYYHWTVVYCELPQLAPFVQELVCHHRSGFRFMDSAEDKFRKRQRVELESETFDKRYESFCGQHDDMNRVRQVYEPSFIVWLAESAPKGFEWDVVAGVLVCSIKGQADSTAELDAMCAAAGVVAKRLFDEAGELLPPASEAPTAPPVASEAPAVPPAAG
ncbi:MAG: hypothetical protein QOJ01_1030 [Solirubrobacterales bacterium]|jgi:hypothetical protein|nr:hypothetical protein [Solirubrobacterales bacterium]